MRTQRVAEPPSGRPAAPPGAFAPLRHRVFAVLWWATLIGNAGIFMRDVASNWLVTELSTSPSSVALVQAAASLPLFLLAIPSGALSDIVDRRKYLISIHCFLAGISVVLTVLAATGQVSVANLVVLTFLGGVVAALAGPTWQSIVPELVPKSELKGAVALNSLGFNISRAVGPAVGGMLLATAGATVTYGINAVSCLFVIAGLVWWPRAPRADDQLAERFGGAVRAGFRYVLASADLRRVLFRAIVFFLFANVAWTLLPLVARRILGGGADFYGVMLGSIGVGAVAGAMGLPRLRNRLGMDRLVLVAALMMAAVLLCLSAAPPQWAGVVAALCFGAAWIAVLTSLNATAQGVLPDWVRGRGLAAYLMAFSGALTLSSMIWGAVAAAIGLRPALLAGGVCLALVSLVLYRFKLPSTDADLTPSQHWPAPAVAATVEHDRGPVLVTVEYKVRVEDREAFAAVLEALSAERRRDGAYAWGASEDAAAPEIVLEWFFVESWAEHLRQHQRVSKADAELQARVRAFHSDDAPPVVRHYLAFEPRAHNTSRTAAEQDPRNMDDHSA
jgi:MFS family permease